MKYTEFELIILLNKHIKELSLIFKYIKSLVLIQKFINDFLHNDYVKKNIFTLFDNIFKEVNYNDMDETNKYYSYEIEYLYSNKQYIDVNDLPFYKEEDLEPKYNEEENKIRFIILLCHIYKTYIDQYEVDLY